MTLRLAPDLKLPDDFATQGTAIIGVRGSGKSNTEVRFAELLHGAGIPFVAIDPKGDWYGVRMEGTGPGLPIPVFGGLYGDFPLDEHNGARIADLLVDENLSAVLDVSRLSKTVGLPRFLVAFCNRLMARHQEEPHVRTVILEEAHRYIPQQVKGAAAELKEAAASVLLEGRAFGLGCWACTQRPARLHNDVLEEVDTAVIHRIGVTATADLARVRKWVEHEDLGTEVSVSLTKLKNGEAWVLSPTALGIVQRVQIDRRTTFDSGATPIVGAKRREMATMATIDAGAIKEALAESIEKAKATDPKVLQARVRELERENVALREARSVEPERVIETIEVPVIQPEDLTFMRAVLATYDHVLGDLTETRAVVADALARLDALKAKPAPADPIPARAPSRPTPPSAGTVARAKDDGSLPKAERAFLTVLAQHGAQERAPLATLAGYSVKSRHVDNVLGTLRSKGYVTIGWPVGITTLGGEALGDYAPLPTGDELRDYWLSHARVSKAGAEFLRVLFDHYPEPIHRDDLAREADYSVGSRHVDNTLGLLRTLGLAVGGRDGITASPTLYA